MDSGTLSLSCLQKRIQVKSMAKHMTFEDRCRIEQEPNNGSSLAEIARVIGKDRSTISREIRKHRVLRETKGNACRYRYECDLPASCPVNCHPRKYAPCRRACRKCNEDCDRYVEEVCRMISKPPYVCKECVEEIKMNRRCCAVQHLLYRILWLPSVTSVR